MSGFDSYTSSLLHMDGADASTAFADETGKPWTAAANAQIDTAQSEFGGASGLFDGTGDYISTGNSTDFDFGTGDWTIDFWIRRNGTKAYPGIVSANVNAGNGWNTSLGNSDNKIRVVWDNTVKILTAGTIADLTWTHIAIVRFGNTVTVYINGVADANTDDCTGDTIGSSGTGSVVGRLITNLDDYYWNGHIDELRISKGIARWTANFTPPASPYSGNIFVPTQDTLISDDVPTTNYDTLNYLGIGDHNAAATKWRILAKWDFSSIPSPITSAVFRIYLNLDLSDNARIRRVYRLKRAYGKTTVTWNKYDGTNDWQTAGASGANDREQTDIGSASWTATETIPSWKEITLTASAVEEMRNGTFTNNGLIIVTDTETNDGYLTDSLETSSARPMQLVLGLVTGQSIVWIL